MTRGVDYARLDTEQGNAAAAGLDRLPTRRILSLMSREDARVVRAVRAAQGRIASASDLVAEALRDGGRLFLVGAGTSGRLAVLEAAECPPTFGTQPRQVQAIMAGGRGAVFRSKEGAEDDERAGRAEARRRGVGKGDVLGGVAASGVTPFVRGALAEAARRGARTFLVTCARQVGAPWQGQPGQTSLLVAGIGVDVRIELAVGPEVLAGSTRLKAGSATKMALNMITLAAFVRLGKVYDRWMVDVRPMSRKLRERARRLVTTLTGLPDPLAEDLLRRAKRNVKTAVVMFRTGLPYRGARELLTRAGGSLREALVTR